MNERSIKRTVARFVLETYKSDEKVLLLFYFIIIIITITIIRSIISIITMLVLIMYSYSIK